MCKKLDFVQTLTNDTLFHGSGPNKENCTGGEGAGSSEEQRFSNSNKNN